MQSASKSKNREGAGLWLVKILLGPFIVVLLGLHFVVNHLVAPGGLLTWADVVAYYQNPIIPIVEILFLVTVVTHGLLGLRSVLLDLNPGQRLLKGLDALFVLVGVVSIVYGIWLVFTIIAFGRATP